MKKNSGTLGFILAQLLLVGVILLWGVIHPAVNDIAGRTYDPRYLLYPEALYRLLLGALSVLVIFAHGKAGKVLWMEAALFVASIAYVAITFWGFPLLANLEILYLAGINLGLGIYDIRRK